MIFYIETISYLHRIISVHTYLFMNIRTHIDQFYIPLILLIDGNRKRIPAPMWLQASGPKHHSDVQLKTGINLASLKRKYKKSLCLYCAGRVSSIYQMFFYLYIYGYMYICVCMHMHICTCNYRYINI
jgi:hypothetical protein